MRARKIRTTDSVDFMKPEDFEEFIRKFLPDNINADDLAAAAGLPKDPESLRLLIEQMQSAMRAMPSSDSGVNWDLALSQATQIARKANQPVPDGVRREIDAALQIGSLWLGEATSFSQVHHDPKLLSRDLWVADAIGLFKVLAGPVADRMSSALAENLQQNAPEELAQLLGAASGLLKSAGATIFAMQLGQALAKLSTEVLAGGDTGLPILDRPAFIPQNLMAFVAESELPADQVYIYLIIRELAITSLFRQSRWLRDQVTNQITRYAAGISIDSGAINELAEDLDLENPEELKRALESGAFIAERTDEQKEALEAIETALAMIEGWVEAVTTVATTRLPKQSAIAEAVRRRRAVGGPAEHTFAALVGLELRPRKLREATAFWLTITEKLGASKRDSVFEHPDLLPTAQELENVEDFIARLGSNGDSMDDELRKLLGETD